MSEIWTVNIKCGGDWEGLCEYWLIKRNKYSSAENSVKAAFFPEFSKRSGKGASDILSFENPGTLRSHPAITHKAQGTLPGWMNWTGVLMPCSKGLTRLCCWWKGPDMLWFPFLWQTDLLLTRCLFQCGNEEQFLPCEILKSSGLGFHIPYQDRLAGSVTELQSNIRLYHFKAIRLFTVF